ncbi:MAG TPA: MlaA family lipoprotein [Lysobacter sp.]|nr:MlaA family lipoprotein [Lysobacter sp.]
MTRSPAFIPFRLALALLFAAGGVAAQAAPVAPASSQVVPATQSASQPDPAMDLSTHSATPAAETNTVPAAVDARTQPAADATPDDAQTMPASVAPVASEAPATDAAPQTGAQQVPTDAEQDYAALYGDPTLPTPAELPQAFDPWEPFNRRMHRFNDVVDRRVAKPLAKAYIAVVPRPLRLGVGNFFSNLGQPLSAINALLQGKPKQAGQALGRFALNATLGVGGIFDPASDAKLPHRSEDFGQTLGVWGWKRSRYVELPLFGPRTVRDVFGMVGDAPLSPLRQIEDDRARVFLQGLQLVDVRTQLMAVDSMREGAADDYSLVRDAWTQRRNYQIFGDRQVEDDSSLPDYLREENNPTVPIDAIPVTPMDGG